MPKLRFQAIDEYIDGQPARVQAHLVRLRPQSGEETQVRYFGTETVMLR